MEVTNMLDLEIELLGEGLRDATSARGITATSQARAAVNLARAAVREADACEDILASIPLHDRAKQLIVEAWALLDPKSQDSASQN